MTETALATRPAATVRLSHGVGFWIIATAFMVALSFSTVPTPLYALYQRKDGFPTYMITIIFAAYTVGVVLSLYLAGHVSDWLGRRRVILAALLVQVLSAVLFLTEPGVPGLMIARFLCGVGIGGLTATATAHLSELRAVARPTEDVARSGLISSVVNMGGLAIGPLAGGLLAQYAKAPLTLPYLIFLILLVLSALGVALVPETVERREERPAYRPQRVALPRGARPTFFAATTGSFSAFAILGLFTALAPSFLAVALHQPSRLVAGASVFSVLGAAALAQILAAKLTIRVQLTAGIVLISAALIAIPAAVLMAGLWLFVLSGITAGAGIGLLFRSSIATVAGLAAPESRGEALAAFFLITYVGMALPVVLIGLALLWVSIQAALVVFSLIFLLLIVWSGTRILGIRSVERNG